MADQQQDEETGIIWIRTDPGPDGVYRPSLEIDDDTSVFLDRELAISYCEYVLAQCARAEHDSRVYRQLSAGATQEAATQVLLDLRRDRPPVTSPIPQLVLEPGVSANRNGVGYLKVHTHGSAEPVGQWELGQGHEHALHMLMAVEMANLDEAYRKTLVTLVGLDDTTARHAVGGLSTYDD